jgi:potassium channel subfamily K
MLQTISFSLYLALGAVVFSKIEGWGFTDGLYWADYTLLTIGLGTDFPLTRTLARMLLIPYAAIGITLIGLVVTSVRGLVLERAKTRVLRRRLGKERDSWKQNIQERRRIAAWREMSLQSNESSQPPSIKKDFSFSLRGKLPYRVPEELEKHTKRVVEEGRPPPWHRAEFELMRFLEARSKNAEKYTALAVSFLVILIVWFFGSVIFWICEHVRG